MKLKLLAIASIFSVLLASCQTAPTDPNERPATKSEIESKAVGHTLGKLRYDADGKYQYIGGDAGTYKISEGKICVAFYNGSSRCDRITTNGSTYYLINSGGKRFPWG
jgi:nitrous oxide reductase accessory protein NosL